MTAPKGNIGGVILEKTDDGKSKVSADKADIGGVIIKDKGIEAGTVQINKGSATDNRVIDVNGNFAVYNSGAFKAAGENFVVKATGDVTANSYTAGNVQINKDGHNTITGLSNVEWSGNAGDIVADRAATEGQLMTVQNDVQHISHETVDGMHYTKVEDTQIWNDGRIVTTGTVEAADAEFYADSQELVTAGQLYAAGIIPGEAKATPDKVNSQDSIAIGKGSNADIKATAIGSATSANQYSVVVGHQATADGIESVAVGRGASASNKGTVALGMYAKAEAKNAVALGTNSVADRADTVSVGSKDNERQITNVKAGKEDTDAVNVAQLKGVQDKVGDANFSNTNYAKTADNVTDAVKYVDAQVKVNSDALDAYKAAGIVAGNKVGQYSKAIALGDNATANGWSAVAFGSSASAEGSNSVAIGVDSASGALSTAVGAGSKADGTQATALGQNSNAVGQGTVSLGANTKADGEGAVSIGFNNSAEVAGSVAIGNGAHVYEGGTNSVALGQWSQASDDRVVSVGNDWLKRRITNVAAGTDPTDAVNVQQLTDRTAHMVEWDENTDDTIHGVTLENGMITAADGQFKVYGTGGIYAADGRFTVNGENGNVSTSGTLHADKDFSVGTSGESTFVVNAETGSVRAAGGHFGVSKAGDVTADGGITAADKKFRVYGATGGVYAANGKFKVNGNTGGITAADGAFIVDETGKVTASAVTADSLTAANGQFNAYNNGVVQLKNTDGEQTLVMDGNSGDVHAAGMITGNVLNTGGFIANAAGNVETKGSLTAAMLTTGENGFVANSQGDIEANNTFVKGKFYAGQKDDDSYAVSIGEDGSLIAADSKFRVAADGTVTAVNGGTFDGITLADNTITNKNETFAVHDSGLVETKEGISVGDGSFAVHKDGLIETKQGINAAGGKFLVYDTGLLQTTNGIVAANGNFLVYSEGNVEARGSVKAADFTTETGVSLNELNARTANVVSYDEGSTDTIHGVTLNNSTVTTANGVFNTGLFVGNTVPAADGSSMSAFQIGNNGRFHAAGGNFAVGADGSVVAARNSDGDYQFYVDGTSGEVTAADFRTKDGSLSELYAKTANMVTYDDANSNAIGGVALADNTVSTKTGVFSSSLQVGTNAAFAVNDSGAFNASGGFAVNSDGEMQAADGHFKVNKAGEVRATEDFIISTDPVNGSGDTVKMSNMWKIMQGGTVQSGGITYGGAHFTSRGNTSYLNYGSGQSKINLNHLGQIMGAVTDENVSKVENAIKNLSNDQSTREQQSAESGVSSAQAAPASNETIAAPANSVLTAAQPMAFAAFTKDLQPNLLAETTSESSMERVPVPGEGSTDKDASLISSNGNGFLAHSDGTNTVKGETTFEDKATFEGGLTVGSADKSANSDFNGNVSIGSSDTDYNLTVNGENVMDKIHANEDAIAQHGQAISTLGHKVGELDNRIDEVGAGAAALAALHPLDFDPDNKWDFSAGYGNYRGESAVAFGAFYRPNEDTMFSVGGTVGNDDNMVNAGVSIKIGSGSSGVTTSRVAMAKEIKAMRDVVAKQDAQIQKLTAMVNALVGIQSEPNTTTMFPDVPENHWAYEAVAAMARSGLVKGYPDGEFKGDRTMPRYEFAQIIQNAIQAGAEVDSRLVEEFKPELEYFHIATVAKDKDGNPTIERVRAN